MVCIGKYSRIHQKAADSPEQSGKWPRACSIENSFGLKVSHIYWEDGGEERVL